MDRETSLVAMHLMPRSTSLLRKHLEDEEPSVGTNLVLRESPAIYEAPSSYMLEEANASLQRARSIVSQLKHKGVAVVPFTDARYPEGLRRVAGFPPLLYLMGNVDLLKKSSVAICGSRHASVDGLRHAQRFGEVAAESLLPIVSGYAKGVDTLAHLGALRAGGSTVIVLAEGILHFRLKREFKGVEHLWDNTVVVSQFPPEQPWRAFTAMERNRVICGLAGGLVVVEAHERGGTIAAARECLRQKKPLWVIEHSLPRLDCPGNTILLREGGTGIRTVRELRSILFSLLVGNSRDI